VESATISEVKRKLRIVNAFSDLFEQFANNRALPTPTAIVMRAGVGLMRHALTRVLRDESVGLEVDMLYEPLGPITINRN
jgi:hypothetical protein